MAKFLRFSCCLIATLLCLLAATDRLDAQSFTGQNESLNSPVLNQVFTSYQVFRFDATTLDAYMKSGATAPAQIQLGDHTWRLDLTSNPIISPNYSVQVQTPQGNIVSHPKRNIAFKGYELNSGGKVRLTVNGDFLHGFVEETTDRFYIEPLWYFDPSADHNLFVVYPKSASKPFTSEMCGVTEEQIELQKLQNDADEKKEKNNGAEFSACYEIELAIASDQKMYVKYNSSITDVENHNISVINDVDGDYTGNFNNDFTFVIVTQYVATSWPGPWTASTNAGTLLDSFLAWGNAGNFGVNFDIGELWTDRDFDGGTVGIAYLSAVCNDFKYHCLQDFTADTDLLRCMTSHEIGHNFSAPHDGGTPCNFIMCPFVSHATTWSQTSLDNMNNYMQSKINSGCLTLCGPPPPPLSAGFTWAPDPGCVNQNVTFTDQSSGNITGWAWTFQGGTPPSSTQQNPTVKFASAGMHNVTLTVTGQGTPSSLTQVITITPLPVAGFTYVVDGLIVTFTNTSTDATSHEWDFGDGLTSSDPNPVHEYAVAGFYTVTLTATSPCGTSVKTKVINTAPTADFSASPTNGCASLVVQYTNESSANAVTYSWSFPGGAPSASNQVNPVVVYNTSGTYSATLTATNASGSNTITKTNYITVRTVPVANFTFTVNGAVVTFTNGSSASATSFLWNFGDGNTSTDANPVHTYADPGDYVVVLTATNDCGSTTKTKSVTIVSSGPPHAAFTANPSSGCAPLTVNFTNNSTGASSFNWDFPGGTPSSSTAANPSTVYNTAGTYTVTLTATNSNGTNTATTTITVNTIPTAAFTHVFNNDTTVTFTNASTGASSYLWTFGDGDSSTVASPIHVFPSRGTNITYMVILQTTNECGTVSDTQSVTVITQPKAKFTATPTTGCAPLTVQFHNNSSPNAGSFVWKFPGGVPDTSILKNPVVVYNTPGTYTVKLIAINASGRDTSTRTNYIVVNTTPTAGFTSAANGLTYTFTNTSTGANTYLWTFGDGDSSTVASPVHTYATDGTYPVTLSATNACGTVTSTQTVNAATAPTASFTASTNSGCAPLTVHFNNTSSTNATSFYWDLPGATPSSSTEASPTVVYNVAGTYVATLTATNSAGTSTASTTIIVEGGPSANYNYSVSGLDATFTNTSINSLSYLWDFGDGNSSTDPSPTHTYTADGTYTVTLTASNNCGVSTITQTVVITTNPNAGFSASTTSGCAVLTVSFHDISTGAPVSWAWSFPGGTPNSSTLENPTVQYFTPGVYDVTLVVTSAGGSTSSFTQPGLINVFGAPTGGFTSNVNGSTATFTNNASDATSYIWDFGDGSTSTEENPSHTYAADGTYQVVLSASNNCGVTIIEQTIVISTPPTAHFTFDSSTGCAPFSIQFTNTSSSNATSYQWSFPGGSPSSSTEENPTVTWNAAGVYVVTLTASNAAGSSTSTATITVNAAPSTAFSYTVAGLTVNFSNSTANANSYLWNFGDGNTSTEANPSHTYATTGSYTVTLSATNTCGTITVTQTVDLNGNPPIPAIGANGTSGCAPLTVQFTDQSAGNPIAWNWTFPGGTPSSSTDQNPLVTYNTPGVYDVTLEATNIYGPASHTFPAYISVQGTPSAGFTFTTNQSTVTFTNTSQNAVGYSWNFGDGTNSGEANPVHTYAGGGTYNVTLTAINNCGSTIYQVEVVITTGTGEASWVEAFRLFPNPNTGTFTIQMNGIPQNEVEFTLFNALGQWIKRETVDFGTGSMLRSFNYGNLPAGVYTLRVQAEGQAMYVKVTIGK